MALRKTRAAAEPNAHRPAARWSRPRVGRGRAGPGGFGGSELPASLRGLQRRGPLCRDGGEL